MMYYIYGLFDPRTNQCFYVGKGCRDRMFQHVSKVKRGKTTGNPHLDHKIQLLLTQGLEIVCTKFADLLTEDAAFDAEEHKIQELDIDTLCNLWSGGQRGRSPTQEVREKKSRALKGRKTSPRSEETKAKIREARKLQARRPHSEETKRKISVAVTGKPKRISEETRLRLRPARRKRMLENNPRKKTPILRSC